MGEAQSIVTHVDVKCVLEQKRERRVLVRYVRPAAGLDGSGDDEGGDDEGVDAGGEGASASTSAETRGSSSSSSASLSQSQLHYQSQSLSRDTVCQPDTIPVGSRLRPVTSARSVRERLRQWRRGREKEGAEGEDGEGKEGVVERGKHEEEEKAFVRGNEDEDGAPPSAMPSPS